MAKEMKQLTLDDFIVEKSFDSEFLKTGDVFELHSTKVEVVELNTDYGLRQFAKLDSTPKLLLSMRAISNLAEFMHENNIKAPCRLVHPYRTGQGKNIKYIFVEAVETPKKK